MSTDTNDDREAVAKVLLRHRDGPHGFGSVIAAAEDVLAVLRERGRLVDVAPPMEGMSKDALEAWCAARQYAAERDAAQLVAAAAYQETQAALAAKDHSERVRTWVAYQMEEAEARAAALEKELAEAVRYRRSSDKELADARAFAADKQAKLATAEGEAKTWREEALRIAGLNAQHFGEAKRLREALTKYGRHQLLCSVVGGYATPCTCGLDAALLAPQAPTAGEGT